MDKVKLTTLIKHADKHDRTWLQWVNQGCITPAPTASIPEFARKSRAAIAMARSWDAWEKST